MSATSGFLLGLVLVLGAQVHAKDKAKEVKRKPNQICAAIHISTKRFIQEAMKLESGSSKGQDISSVTTAYEDGKLLIEFKYYDGSNLQMDGVQLCNGSPQVTLRNKKNEDAYECKENVDCMPIVAPEMAKYCKPAFREWAKKNCETQPEFTY